METAKNEQAKQYEIKEPKGLSKRVEWLRDYYFKGVERKWNNEFSSWTTGTDWDVMFQEMTFYIVPEVYPLMQAMKGSYKQGARTVDLPKDFWHWSLPVRREWFVREVIVNYVPQELLPGDLIAGAKFNIQSSMCLNEEEQTDYDNLTIGKHGVRAKVKWFHDHGYGNSGATSGHLIPGYERVLKIGWRGVFADLEEKFDKLADIEKTGRKGEQLKAMIIAVKMPDKLAQKYAKLCENLATQEKDENRKQELLQMRDNLKAALWQPAGNFWEAVQALWISHMLVMTDENYPGPGVSFGLLDQYLLPYWEKSLADGMQREFGKEILKCFWVHCNTAYDAQIRSGNQGISAGFGQLITLSGVGKDGQDTTNDLTYALLEVIDDMTPILEPKPNIRLHRNSPEALLDKVVEMISSSQGAPFLLNFDERSMAGMMREAKLGGIEHLINKDNVHEYAPVGCLENTMVGNDRSGTVDNNLNLLKAVELALNDGRDLLAFVDPITGGTEKIAQDGLNTGDATGFASFDEFYEAYKLQTKYLIQKCVDLYEKSESVRAKYFPTPYLSCMVKGCAEKAIDVTAGGAEISFCTIEAVTYATTVDSLLAIKYLVFDKKACTMSELITALKDNWEGHAVLQAMAKNKAPKYGRDDDLADELASDVMQLWCDETWQYKTLSTNRQFRPGMLSWNYWAGDGFVMTASADGRPKGQFLSNAICPSNGADIKGPTSNTNSVGKVLGGKSVNGDGDWEGFKNILPNGASHTITFNPSILKDPEHKNKFKSFLKGYVENGGTALQINMLDPKMLVDAQKHPQDYRHLLVRVTGYNAYFTSIGRELQNELIARMSHESF